MDVPPGVLIEWLLLCAGLFVVAVLVKERGLTLRRFYLDRDADISGTSGLGRVAEGVELPDGRVILWWTGAPHSIGFYGSLAEMEAVHGHGGDTRVTWEGD